MKNDFDSNQLSEILERASVGLIVFKKDASEWENWNCVFANEIVKNIFNVKIHDRITPTDLLNDSIFIHDFEVQKNTIIYSAKAGHYIEFGKPSESEDFLQLTLRPCETGDSLLKKYHHLLLKEAEHAILFGSWVWDLADQKVEWSNGMYKLLGFDSQKDKIKPDPFTFLNFVHPTDLNYITAKLNSIGQFDSIYIFELKIIDLLGEQKSLYLRGENIVDEETGNKVSIATLLDITTLRDMRSELEGKVADLNNSNAELEHFAYVASHDLQEPLRKIVSFGERLQLSTESGGDREQQFYLDRILASTRRMQEMINNLLEYSRISSTRADFKSTNLNEILKSTLSDLEIAIQENKAVIKTNILPEIDAIPSQMFQLFINLISNGLKFSYDDRPIIINILGEDLTNDQVKLYKLKNGLAYTKLTFSDNGIGFDNKNAETIFTIFKRLRGRSEFEGSGIGLAVCKKVVDAHKGIIIAHGVPDEGATFEVILPKRHI